MKKEKENNYNSDVTKEEVENLKGLREQRTDRKGDDSQLEDRERPVDFTGKDLDVPGRHNKKSDRTDLKDEENHLYSQGSGHNDHLEDAANHHPESK